MVQLELLRGGWGLATLVLVPIGLCGQSQIVPTRATVQPPPYGGRGEPLFVQVPSYYQLPTWRQTLGLYTTREVGAARLLRALSFRPAHGYGSSGMTVDARIELGMSPHRPEDIVPGSFDANYLAQTRRVVLQGPIALPLHNPSSWPVPFLPTMPFASPFAYDPNLGPALAVEIGGIGPRAGTSSTYWNAELSYGGGSEVHAAVVQSDCLNSGGTYSFTRTARASFGYPGSSMSLDLWNYPPSMPSLANNVLILAPSLGGVLGGLQLPVEITRLQLPARPGCRLALLPMAIATMAYVDAGAESRLTIRLPTPNDPGLAGAVFYTQNIALDAGLLFPSVTLGWRLGAASGMPANSIWAEGVTRQSAGNLNSVGGAPVLRLDG